jgi:6,7-dimethyl-8-ribityllumazine synthase
MVLTMASRGAPEQMQQRESRLAASRFAVVVGVGVVDAGKDSNNDGGCGGCGGEWQVLSLQELQCVSAGASTCDRLQTAVARDNRRYGSQFAVDGSRCGSGEAPGMV